MADKKYYDEHGIEISLGQKQEVVPKQYFDVNMSPIQLNPSGVKQPIGSETYTPHVSKEGETNTPPYIGRFLSNSLPAAGSTAFGPVGTLGGTVLSEGLRHLAPNLFGQPASDPAYETIGNLALNDAIPGVASAAIGIAKNPIKLISSRLLRNFPAVREGAIKQLTSQILGQYQKPETQILEDAAKGVIPPPPALSSTYKSVSQSYKELQKPTNEFKGQLAKLKEEMTSGLMHVGNGEFKFEPDITKSQTYKDIANKALSDVTSVQNFVKATGSPEAAEQLAINKLLTGGFKAGEGKLDAVKILDDLGGKFGEVYQEAIRPETMGNFKSLLSEIADQQKHQKLDRVLNWAAGKLMWTAPAALLGGHIGTGAAVAGGAALTNSMLAKAMSNPETANLVIEAMRTQAGTPKANLISRALQGLITPNQSLPALGLRVAGDVATVPEH